ncbi:MAG: hypothetical protein QG641_2644 [Candidatus Poribacteria bacterium]|nr:hypothetical protein [Candidatus Poribacteria bacterium]
MPTGLFIINQNSQTSCQHVLLPPFLLITEKLVVLNKIIKFAILKGKFVRKFGKNIPLTIHSISIQILHSKIIFNVMI